jgi:hypothetical protein
MYTLINIEKIIVEDKAGPTKLKIFTYQGVDYILSSNQAKNEVALYFAVTAPSVISGLN